MELDERRVEEAAMNAWPAQRQLLLDGWVVRFAGGYTRRSNAATPLYESREPDGPKLDACERLYAAQGLPTLFRLVSFMAPAALEAELAARGYAPQGQTLVLGRPIGEDLAALPAPAIVEPIALDAWAALHADLAGLGGEALAKHQAILQLITPAHRAIALRLDGELAACGLAVAEPPLVGLFDLVVAERFRRRGLGSQLVAALAAWGAGQGAQQIYLQQVASNVTAAALYARLGFRERYRYLYWVSGG